VSGGRHGPAALAKRDTLLIAVAVQLGPPFAATLWQSTLTRTWPQLVDEIAGARQGQVSGISERGNPVIIVHEQTEYDLRAGVAEAKLDAGVALVAAKPRPRPKFTQGPRPKLVRPQERGLRCREE